MTDAAKKRHLADIFTPSASTDALFAAVESAKPWDDQRVLERALSVVVSTHWPGLGLDALATADVAGAVRQAAAVGIVDPVDLTYIAWRAVANVSGQREPDDDGDVLARVVIGDDGASAIPARTRRHYRARYGTGMASLTPVLERWQREARIAALMREGRSEAAAKRAYQRERQKARRRSGVGDQ